jgi:hypothetical protein
MRLVYWPETLHLKGREAFVPAHKGIWEEYERKRARKMNPDPKPVQAKKPAPKLSDRIEPPSAWEAYDRALKEHRESTLARAREIGNAMVRHDDRG